MANEAVNQVIADYYRDFSTLNVQAILPYFNEPSLLVGPQGVIPIPNHSALVACGWKFATLILHDPDRSGRGE